MDSSTQGSVLWTASSCKASYTGNKVMFASLKQYNGESEELSLNRLMSIILYRMCVLCYQWKVFAPIKLIKPILLFYYVILF